MCVYTCVCQDTCQIGLFIIIIMDIFRAHSSFFKTIRCEHKIRKTNSLKALCMMQSVAVTLPIKHE